MPGMTKRSAMERRRARLLKNIDSRTLTRKVATLSTQQAGMPALHSYRRSHA